MFRFERLDVWKKAVELYEKTCAATDSLKAKDQFSLGEQLRRVSLSVSTNIAEGTGRNNEKESKYFFNIAKGSVYETVSLLNVMKKRGYIKKEEDYINLYNNAEDIAKMLSGLMK
jgi:four helix bundle protein